MLSKSQRSIFNPASEQRDWGFLQSSVCTSNLSELPQQQLRCRLKNGYPPIDQVAEASGMSLRSFQRQLAKDNLSYSRLVDQARFDEAVRLLQDPTLKLIEIALELGYSDPASFTRAFKRWTGMCPTKFRNDQ